MSITVIVPAAFPVVVGANVTLIVQLFPDVSEAPQVFVTPKLLEPEGVMLMFERAAILVFFSVIVCTALVVLMISENVTVEGMIPANAGRVVSRMR